MKVLVTGGAGYIGSHTVISLLNHGHDPFVIDNFNSGTEANLAIVEKLTGTKVPYMHIDITDEKAVLSIFNKIDFDAVIHFAALKSVSQSISEPLDYYSTNVAGLLNVLKGFLHKREASSLSRFIFSSSATVYGPPEQLPVSETQPVGNGIANPYGWSKYMGEQILNDCSTAYPNLQAIALRYFNPLGAHESGLLGENTEQIPNNIAPYITKVACGELPFLSIFGNDYDTPDGSGIRDYVHVMDIAEGHVAALNFSKAGFHAINLGTGKGTSVFELVKYFENTIGLEIPIKIVERRPGDLSKVYADPEKAFTLLGWRATKSIQLACEDSWRWQLNLSKQTDK